jgi:WD40 repeat protein
MAPEQKRGEYVDQRADVFAIGAMLWELCAPQKVQPAEPHERHRMLRGAGIDQDLATIIIKALDPEFTRRYPHAGALAADLKAFKSGARITARSYSLPALLAHWIRRHRALAVSATAAIVLAATGVALYVRNIAVERRRAAHAEEIAKASLDELTLKHAQLLLTTDPSAAIDALAKYHGADLTRAHQIRAEAAGLGVALLRAVPHTDNVLWAEGTPDGGIVSLGTDGTISRTSRDGTSAVVVRGVAQIGQSSYSPARHLLAYACDPSDLCLLDILHNARIPVAPMLRGAHVTGLSFSPDGTLLALMSQEAVLRIFDVTDPAQPLLRLVKAIDGGIDVKFLDENVVAAGTTAGVEFVRLNGDSEPFAVPDGSHWDARASEHKLAIATTKGQAVVLQAFPLHVVTRTDLCHGPIVGLKFIPGRQGVAYACREGSVGIWDLQRGMVTPRVQLEGHADLIAVSPAGDYLVAGGGNGTVTVVDLHTDLVASYKGHGFRLTSITPPTPEHPFVTSADAHGAVRAWRLPPRFARVATTSDSPFHTAIFDKQSANLTATTWQPVLTTFSSSTGLRTVGPHEPYNIFLEQSSDGRVFATYGLTDVVELWEFATMARTHVIRTGQGSVSQLRFFRDTDDFVTLGRDGRLIRWTPSGKKTSIVQVNQPIEQFALAPGTGSIVFSTIDGALGRTDTANRVYPLRSAGPRVNRMLTPPDQRRVYAGYANGDVISIDTKSWKQENILHTSEAIRDIVITDDGHTIAVATSDGTIHVGTRHDDASSFADASWVALPARARHLSVAPDGLLVAACTDGTIWLYLPTRERWICLPTGIANFGWSVITTDGNTAAALDLEGRAIWIELDAARKLLDR